MITAKFVYSGDIITGFSVSGHSGSAEIGKDIICSAVSSASYMTVNTLTEIMLLNPEIIETSGEQGGMEGCLSFPGKQGYVVRPNHVRVQAYDRNGELYEYEGEELFARAILHENDHLDGLIYTRLVTDPPEGYKEEELEYTEPEDDTEEEK